MKRVGLTGGIGCGKSTVAEVFRRDLGISCFVADTVAADYYLDTRFLADVRALLGDGVFRPDGSADKRAIAQLVFRDPVLLQGLNALVHPRVRLDFEQFCNLHADEPYVIFESAILFDHGFDRLMDAVVCVYLDREERLRRLALRDHTSREAIEARMANQMPADEMMRRADFVVLNYEGNPRLRQVRLIDQMLRQT